MRCVRSVLAGLVAVMVVVGLGAAPTAAASRHRPYLVLGDSLSAGYQPGRGGARGGGYVGHVRHGLARAGAPVRVTNLSCSGETTRSMRDGGRCRYREGSQLRAAVAFLRAHPDTAFVSVSLGGNDLLACLDRRTHRVDGACARRTAGALRSRLLPVLQTLRRHAPTARIAVLDQYDPLQAAPLLGWAGRGSAATASLLRTRANSAIHEAARAAGVRVAWVSEPFDDGWLRRVDLPGHGRVPIRVARICRWTWMCSRGDVHPNDEGYRVIAGAVVSALTRRR